MTDHIFVVNPAAGKEDRTEPIKKAATNIRTDGKVEIYTTSCPGDATRFLEERLKDAPYPVRVYACGGDGTLHEVVEGVYRAQNPRVAVGPIPTGSGNDFIKYFGIPEAKFRSIPAMSKGRIVPCDLIKLTDDFDKEAICVNIASAGFDADVSRSMQKIKNFPMMSGSGAYKAAVVKQLFSKLGHRYKVLADGKPVGEELKDEYLFVLGANGSHYGGGFKASPKSKIDDGLLNLIIIEKIDRVTFVRIVGKYRKGEYFEDLEGKMLHKTVRSLQILSENPIPMNLDGEDVLMKNPLMEILPSAMMLILPE